jgi:hypothetical protein
MATNPLAAINSVALAIARGLNPGAGGQFHSCR